MLTVVAEKSAIVQVALPPPPGSASVLGGDPLREFVLGGPQSEQAKLEIVDVKSQPFPRALRIQTNGCPAAEWSVLVHASNAAPIHAGDVLLASFWIRCVESMTDEAFATFVLQLARPEWDKCVEFRASAGQQWRQYSIPFRALRYYAPGDAQICFRVGFEKQTVEIGGVQVINHGATARIEDLPRTRVTYAGRRGDARWRQEALERIDRIRKADLLVQVRDPAGRPVPDVQVHVKMLRHAFGFGSAVDADCLTGTSADNDHYRQTFESLFNRAVFENDMKWPQCWGGVRPAVDRAMDWLSRRQIAVRGHCLIWPSWRWLPRDLKQFESSPQKLRELCAQRVSEMVGRYRGRLYQWDVINEPYKNHDLMDILGKDVMVEWFRLARQADPDCKLFLNEYGIIDTGGTDKAHQQHFYDTIRYLKDNGAPIDGIGIQSHFGIVLTQPTAMLKILDRFSELGLPIESTELSLNIADRQLQADFMRDYLIAVFSHPNVHGIMLWGFWEGRHWRPDAALYTRDWKLRPHGKAWIDLVHGQWKTDEKIRTDREGRASIRGFCGEYEVTAVAGGRSATIRIDLPSGGRQVKMVLA